jgi:hypothetical protein
MKNINLRHIIVLLFAVVSFCGCDSTEDDFEDCLVGNPWQLEKTVTYDGTSRFDRSQVTTANYGESAMKFFYNGDVSIMTTTVGRFGRVYEDWFEGRWHSNYNELCISTSDGDYYYTIYSYSHWNMILQYTAEDEYGLYLVEEYYSR